MVQVEIEVVYLVKNIVLCKLAEQSKPGLLIVLFPRRPPFVPSFLIHRSGRLAGEEGLGAFIMGVDARWIYEGKGQ